MSYIPSIPVAPLTLAFKYGWLERGFQRHTAEHHSTTSDFNGCCAGYASLVIGVAAFLLFPPPAGTELWPLMGMAILFVVTTAVLAALKLLPSAVYVRHRTSIILACRLVCFFVNVALNLFLKMNDHVHSSTRRARMLQLWRSNVVSVVLYAWRHRLPFQWELLLQCATHLWVICFMNLPLCALFGGAPLSSSCLSRLAAAAPYYVDHAGDAAPGGESQSGGNPFVAAVEPLYAAVARLAEQLGGASGGGSAAYPASNPFAFLPADAEAMQDCADVRGCWTNVTLVQSVCFCVLLTAIHHFERAARIQYLRSMAPDVFQLVEFRGMHVMLILQCVWCMAITARFLLFSPTI